MPPDLDRGDQQVRTGNLDGRRTGIKKLMSVKGLICGCFTVKLKMEEYKIWNNIHKRITITNDSHNEHYRADLATNWPASADFRKNKFHHYRGKVAFDQRLQQK